ncbi:MAG: hypothetical protein ABI229_04890 [Gemmatimonadaceae bacterium]
MSKYIRRAHVLAHVLIATPAAIAILAIGACSGGAKNDSLAQDTTLNRDIQLANRDSAAQPQLKDVPATTTPAPAPATAQPRPVTAAPAHPARRPTPTPTRTTTASGNTVTRTPGTRETALGTIAAGTSIGLTSNSRVCTNTNHVGETITATVAQSVSGSNGAVIPAGATAALEITQLKRSENMNDKIQMSFRVVSISFGGHTYPVTASVSSAQVDRVKNEPGSKDAQKVATGAAVGAIVGQILGKSTKSTIIGGAVGAAAGAGTAAATANYEGCVPTGGNITIALENSVQVHS